MIRRKSVLVTVGLLLLGACATAEKTCPFKDETATRELALPTGCSLDGSSDTRVHNVICADGRTGYAIL